MPAPRAHRLRLLHTTHAESGDGLTERVYHSGSRFGKTLAVLNDARLERALNVLVRIGRAQQREAAIPLCCNFARLTYLMRRAQRVKQIVRAMVKP